MPRCMEVPKLHNIKLLIAYVELLSWCRGILDRLDKLARDRLLYTVKNDVWF